MFEDFIKKILEEPTEEENQMADVLRLICVQDYLTTFDTITALRYFNGLEPKLIINKISVVNTPLIYEAMRYAH